MKRHIIGIAVLFIALPALSQVEAINQEGTFTLDEVGHADISIKTRLNAQQWQQWMGVYGNSQHVLKRDMKNSFSQFHVDRFSMDRADSDREYSVKFSAHGAAVYRGNDRWEMDLDEGIRARKLNEQQWLIQMTQSEGGELIQQDFTINLPDGVQSSEQAVGEFGQDVVRYVLPTEGGASGGTMLWSGSGSAILGGIFLALGLRRRPVKTVVASTTSQIEAKPEPIEGERVDRPASHDNT